MIVLDDDPSIHEAWNEKFIGVSDIKIEHFYNASDLSLKKIEELNPDLYLIDYELLADNINGLDVIANLELKTKAILVTSCFEDLAVRSRCKKLAIQIIPKPYVPYIKINLRPQILSNAPFVFIDDDEMMRTTWAFAASDAGAQITVYSTIDEFMSVINDYTNDTIIYIDSDLDNNIKGEIEAKKLFDLGFTEIHLATGHSPKRFENIPWVKSIVGKSPPF
jgi:FixJ family two-component response regulator